jgi:hypothetical protein
MTTETPQPRISLYTLHARLAPALLAASPAFALGIFALPLLPGAQKLWGLLSVGLTSYAALVARKAGNRVQPDLWTRWGGAPTARRLRYREGVSAAEISRRHRDFERALGDSLTLPTAEEETADPTAADSEYQQAVRRFISKVRNDPVYPLIQVENRNYGFARNLLGLKPLGLSCAIAVLAISTLAAVVVGLTDGWSSDLPLAFPCVVSALALILWRQVDADFVRPSADAYADRVVDAAQDKANP